MHARYLVALFLSCLLAAGAPALAVEVLEDHSLTQIAGQDAVRLEKRDSTLSSSAPTKGDPIRSSRKKVADDNLENIDNTLENARNLGPRPADLNDAPSPEVQKPMASGEYGFPKRLDTKSTHNPAPGHHSPGTFQQSNVKMQGSVKMTGNR
ncbi:MAG: hypothetical protein RL210_1435 [Pseudomonadota bacterium]|jgi:hypothetical protein|nr:hypothetical protein [Pseudomonadota bacterium]